MGGRQKLPVEKLLKTPRYAHDGGWRAIGALPELDNGYFSFSLVLPSKTQQSIPEAFMYLRGLCRARRANPHPPTWLEPVRKDGEWFQPLC